MNLVLFEDALEHLLRIHRIIRMPRGNALLVGVGGSGKQSLTRLAACCANYYLFEIQLNRGYGEPEFREDLKKLYIRLCKEPVVFMFSDAQVIDESFLELINNMLTTGIVPALFSDEEKSALIESMRKEFGSNTQTSLWSLIINRCRDNLHVVLCMSPGGDQLRRRCRSFPGLVCNTIIDWFFAWPSDALLAVANHFLVDGEVPDEHKSQLVQHMVKVHLSVQSYSIKFMQELRRHNSVTPKNFLDYIANYRRKLSECRLENEKKSKRLVGGLQKLIEAAEAVDAMQEELKEKKVVVDAASMECAKMIEQIRQRSAEVEQKRKLANEKNQELQLEGERIAQEKKLAEAALDEALPALEAAAEALKNLKKDDITMVKSYANPPGPVKDVCQCVLELKPFGKEDPTQGWAGAKSMMSDPTFLSKLQNYPRDDITEKQVQKVTKILKKKTDAKSAVTVENLDRISAAGKGLLVWVLAIIEYNRVAKNVEPRRKKVKTMEKEMAQSQADLRQIRAELSQLESEIAQLSKSYEEKSSESRELAQEAEKMEKYLAAANKLIQGLGSERTRWSKDKDELQIKKTRFVGDCLLAAAFLSYTGAFTFSYRNEMIYNDWQSDLISRKVPITNPFRLEALLTTAVQISSWVSEGLPADEMSIQNGILTTQASRFPLCIDPQMQALKWIKERESRVKKLTVQTFNDSDFLKYLELCVQFGNPFLFEGVDEDVDPIINPILEKNLIVSGSGKQLQLGDKLIDWDDGFRLYMVTKLSNPDYSAELAGRTMIINYSVTLSGLEDQLLDVVVGNERPDLQQQREELIQTMSKNSIKLVELEAVLLRELTEATGNILENSVLIGVLENAKSKSVSIAEQLEESAITAAELEKITAGYRPAAHRGAILFFAMASLSNISKMYEYSLSSFLLLFSRALTISERDPMISYRLRNIIVKLTKTVYDYVCTGIFERHKLMFSFQMTVMIMEDAIDRQELDFFLKGNVSLDGDDKAKLCDWMSPKAWTDLQRLPAINAMFADVLKHVQLNNEEWERWQERERPEDDGMPGDYTATLTRMQQMLIIRCLRPDRIYSCVRRFVIETMGDSYYVQPPVLEFSRILSQSSSKSPVVFILSPGADPMVELDKLAEQNDVKQANRFRHLALGQGQGDIALSLLKLGSSRGFWVVLQNCHLMPSWLKTLEKTLESLSLTSVHQDFRLWLTTDPTPRFPLGILQKSMKVVTEPPDGLRLNIRSSYSRITDDMLHECPHPAFSSLVYVLSFFHAVVQERRKYGKIGWNVPYDFNESDFNVSFRLLSMYLTKACQNQDETIPWESLRYLIGEAMYGGRVTDSYDRRVLITYLHEYMGDFIFDRSQPFYFSRSSFDYVIPSGAAVKEYDERIQEIPLDYSPEVFGLHSNAEIGYFTNATKQLWRDLIDLQPRTVSAGSGGSREDMISNAANDIQHKVPEPFDVAAIRKSFEAAAAAQSSRPDHQLLSPCAIVLMQELERWNLLVSKMSASLMDLQKALTGEIGMSAELEALATSLYNGYLPDMWRPLAPQTKKMLGSWMHHFQRRYQQYQQWIKDKDDPIVVWLSGLHIPESYLTALVQSTCRRRKWSLDKSTLYTKVTTMTSADQVKSRPIDGCFIQGLYLEGAGWDYEKSCLTRPNPKQLIVELPILQVIPIELSKLKLANTFRTPVYVTQERRGGMGDGYVFEADLSALEHSSHWILQGTALVLNTDQ